MSRLPEYLAWLQPKMNDYNELMTKYKSLKEKECAITSNTQYKRERKEALLRAKEDSTLTREDNLELDKINREANTEAMFLTNMHQIETRRSYEMRRVDESYNREVESARAIFDSSIVKAEARKNIATMKADEAYNSTATHYRAQKEQSLTATEREYNEKKRKLDEKKQKIEDERKYTLKTAVEITLEQDKLKILQELQKVIRLIEYAKTSTLHPNELEDAPTVPVLPEPIVTQFTPAPIPTPVAPTPAPVPVTPPVVKYDYSMLGEDPATVALRQEMKLKRREKDMEEEARLREETANRPPTRYGFIHELEKRPYVKPSYVPPVIEDEPEEKSEEKVNDFFTKSLTSDDES